MFEKSLLELFPHNHLNILDFDFGEQAHQNSFKKFGSWVFSYPKPITPIPALIRATQMWPLTASVMSAGSNCFLLTKKHEDNFKYKCVFNFPSNL